MKDNVDACHGAFECGSIANVATNGSNFACTLGEIICPAAREVVKYDHVANLIVH